MDLNQTSSEKDTSPSPSPIHKVSSGKYPAKVRFRIKGQPEGPVFQGQEIIHPCKGCGHAPATNSQ